MPRTCSSRCPFARKVGQALLAIQSNRAKEHARSICRHAVRQAHDPRGLHRFGTGVEGILPSDPAGRSGGAGSALQGWATDRDLSGQDWKGIELTLVSGRPVAFHQALYEAYYRHAPGNPVVVADGYMPTSIVAVSTQITGRRRISLRRLQHRHRPTASRAKRRLRRPWHRRPMAGGPSRPSDRCRDPGRVSSSAPGQCHQRSYAVDPDPRPPGPAQRLALYRRTPRRAIRWPHPHPPTTARPACRPHPDDLTSATRGQRSPTSADARLSGFPVARRAACLCARREDHDRTTVARTEPSSDGKLVTACCGTRACCTSRRFYRVRGPAKEPRQLIVVQRRLPSWTLVKPTQGSRDQRRQLSHSVQLPAATRHRCWRSPTADPIAGTAPPRRRRRQIKLFAQARSSTPAERGCADQGAAIAASYGRSERQVAQLDAERQKIVEEQERLRENLARVPDNSDLQRAISRPSTGRDRARGAGQAPRRG